MRMAGELLNDVISAAALRLGKCIKYLHDHFTKTYPLMVRSTKRMMVLRELKGRSVTDILHLNEAPYLTLVFGVACCHLCSFWRLIENDCVAFSVSDDGQLFGMTKPFS